MKQVHFTNAVSSINEEGKEVYTFDSVLYENDEVIGSQKEQSIVVQEGDTVQATFRKLCDEDIEVFLNGESIGFGATNFGIGMTPEQLENSANTPEADASFVPPAQETDDEDGQEEVA